MKKIFLLFCTLLISFSISAQQARFTDEQARPLVEVMFVLDTTGSMGGLLAGAKQKIWSIATAIAKGKPTPELKVGLVAYRDVTDAYVTRFYDLTENIDGVYEKLQSFKAAGGGDTREHVNKALDEAVRKASWSSAGKNVLQIVYLVGDAPPHTDYKDGYNYKSTLAQAKERGIFVNTIQCGTMQQTTPIWKEIAQIGMGRFARIGQTGNMVTIVTPYDKKLAELNDSFSDTFIGYGKHGRMRKKSIALADEGLRSSSAKASKAEYQALNGGRYFGKTDLLNAIEAKTLKLKDIKKDELPEKLKKMNTKQLQAYIKEKQERRKQIKKIILQLSKRRSQYIAVESKKRSKGKKTFDSELMDMLGEQGARKGIAY